MNPVCHPEPNLIVNTHVHHIPKTGEILMTSKSVRLCVIALGLFITLAAPANAQDVDDVRESLVAIIAAVERGWETGDGAPFRKHFLDVDGARYIESGGQNEGLEDLITHHVEPEIDALGNFDLQLTNIETHVEDSFAWAIADVELTATIKRDGRDIHRRGHETFLFRRVGSDWKVIHTHSSTRPVKKK